MRGCTTGDSWSTLNTCGNRWGNDAVQLIQQSGFHLVGSCLTLLCFFFDNAGLGSGSSKGLSHNISFPGQVLPRESRRRIGPGNYPTPLLPSGEEVAGSALWKARLWEHDYLAIYGVTITVL